VPAINTSKIIDNQCRRQGLDLSKPNTLTGRDQLIAVITPLNSVIVPHSCVWSLNNANTGLGSRLLPFTLVMWIGANYGWSPIHLAYSSLSENESSTERKFHFPGAKGPGNELAREGEGQGAKGPGSESSRERIGQGPIGPGAKRLGTSFTTCMRWRYASFITITQWLMNGVQKNEGW